MPETILVEVAPSDQTTALLYAAPASDAKGITLILGHGAGAPQRSAFMVTFANELAQRGIDTVTFNFLYTEHKRRLPDRNDRLEQCYRAVIDTVRERGARRLAIGGKSMGGRIASQVAAAAAIDLAGLRVLRLSAASSGQARAVAIQTLARHSCTDVVRARLARYIRHAG